MTVVREDVTSKTEVAFTRNLVWEPVPVSGRRVRITQEDADRFEEIQARRVFGDAEVRYFAVVNPLYPDAGNPSVIAGVDRRGGSPPQRVLRPGPEVDQHGDHHLCQEQVPRRHAGAGHRGDRRPPDRSVDTATTGRAVLRVLDEAGFDHNSDWVGAYKVLSCKRLLSRVARRAE